MKTWYTSKTLWLNLIAVIALVVQTQTEFVIDPETQGGILSVINLILRLVTKQPLEWVKPADDAGSDDQPHFIPPGTAGFVRLPLLFLVALVMATLVAGCATTGTPAAKDTPLQTAGKSLLAVQTSIVTAARVTDNLCKAGTLNKATCAQAKIAYEKTKPAYDMAVDAYLIMSSGGGDPADFESALLRVQNMAANFLLIADQDAKGGAK